MLHSPTDPSLPSRLMSPTATVTAGAIHVGAPVESPAPVPTPACARARACARAAANPHAGTPACDVAGISRAPRKMRKMSIDVLVIGGGNARCARR
jgi:hypothetical protein